MNKTELVKKVAAENELSQKQAAAVVDSVLNAVVDTVAAGEAGGHGVCREQHPRLQGRQGVQGEGQQVIFSVQDRSSCNQLLLFIIQAIIKSRLSNGGG